MDRLIHKFFYCCLFDKGDHPRVKGFAVNGPVDLGFIMPLTDRRILMLSLSYWSRLNKEWDAGWSIFCSAMKHRLSPGLGGLVLKATAHRIAREAG